MEIAVGNKNNSNITEESIIKETALNVAKIIKEDTYGLFKVKFDDDVNIRYKSLLKKTDKAVNILSELKSKKEKFENNLEKIKNENRIVISKLLGKLQ